jgi:hypothetical protein
MWKTSASVASKRRSRSPRGPTFTTINWPEAVPRHMDMSSVELLAPHHATDSANDHSAARDIQSFAVVKGAAAGSIGSDAVPDHAKAPTDRSDTTTDQTPVGWAPMAATSNQTSATNDHLPAGDDRSLTTHDAPSRVRMVTDAAPDLTEPVDEVRGRG